MASKPLEGGSFEEEGHIYRDRLGRRVLSVTQVFDMLGLIDYSRVDPETLRRKAELGTAVHNAIESLLSGNAVHVETEHLGYVDAGHDWFLMNGFEVEGIEEQGIARANGMSYGYSIDVRGRMVYRGRRRRAIVDLKTSLDKSPTWALQTAAYARAAPKIIPAAEPGNSVPGDDYLRIVLHLTRDGRCRALFYDDPRDDMTFLYMLYCANWKFQNSLLSAVEVNGLRN